MITARNPEFISGSKIKFRIKFGIAIILTAVFYIFLPRFVSAATINLSPASGSFGVGSSFTVSIRANTQGADTNTAEATISYSTDTLDLISVKQGSTYYLAAPGSPSKGTGTAYFGGGLPSPGYNGTNGLIGSMTFRARAIGTATVSVVSGKVLLNDGLGTNAYSGSTTARYNITPPPVASPVVSSSTHPDPDKWYAKPDLEVSWSRPKDAYGFSFELNQDPDTIPDNTLDTTTTMSKSYQGLKDGTWYFHIKARPQSATQGFGATTHFRVQIDTQKPLLFDIQLTAESNLNDVTRTPTITFEAQDETSGIERYEVAITGPNDGTDKLNGVVSDNAKSPYTFEKLTGGPHVIRVTAYDKAGNDRKSELPVIITSPKGIGFFERTVQMPIYLVLIFLILFASGGWFIYKRRLLGGVSSSHLTSEMTRLQSEIDKSLEQLKIEINRKLLDLSVKSTDASIDKKIRSTKRRIDSKIDKLRRK